MRRGRSTGTRWWTTTHGCGRKRDPEVVAYLEAENAWCQHVMAGTEDLQKQLYDEMRSHIKETDVSVPFRDREYWYYQRTEEGKQYEIYCRKRGNTGRADRARKRFCWT